jgi:hypothetical protein
MKRKREIKPEVLVCKETPAGPPPGGNWLRISSPTAPYIKGQCREIQF